MKKYLFLFSCFLFAFFGLNAQTLSFQSGITVNGLVRPRFNDNLPDVGATANVSWSGKIHKRWGYKTGVGYQGVYKYGYYFDCPVGEPESIVSIRNMRIDILVIPVAFTADLTFWKKCALQWNISAGKNLAFIQNYRNTYYTQNNQTETRNVAPQRGSIYLPAFRSQWAFGTEMNYPLSPKLSLGLGGQALLLRLPMESSLFSTYSVYSTVNWRFW